jgi:hypothetical protein
MRWAHEGKPQEGELLLAGPVASCRGDFTDTFHAASGLVLHGHGQGSTVLLYGTYPAGDGSPDWGRTGDSRPLSPDVPVIRDVLVHGFDPASF